MFNERETMLTLGLEAWHGNQTKLAAGRSDPFSRVLPCNNAPKYYGCHNLLTARKNGVSLLPRLVWMSLNWTLSTVPSDLHSSLPFNSEQHNNHIGLLRPNLIFS